jgi:DnaJ-domain-containing protein 1
MFDRFFNVLRANLNDYLAKDQYSTQEMDELDRQYREAMGGQNSQAGGPGQGPQGPSAEEAAYYAALELKPGTGFPEIKAAYKRLIKQYHPDRFHNDPARHQTALELSKRLNEAYNYFEKKFGK